MECKSQYENVHEAVTKMKDAVHMNATHLPEDSFHRLFSRLVHFTSETTNTADFPIDTDSIKSKQVQVKYNDNKFEVAVKEDAPMSKVDAHIAYKFTLQLVQMIKKLCSVVIDDNKSLYVKTEIERCFSLVKTLLSSIKNGDEKFYQSSVTSVAFLIQPCFLAPTTSMNENQATIQSRVDISICELIVESNCYHLMHKCVVSLIEKLCTWKFNKSKMDSLLDLYGKLEESMTLGEVSQVNNYCICSL